MANYIDKIIKDGVEYTIHADEQQVVNLIKSTAPENLKYGAYIYDGEDTFKWVEVIPSDYGGIAFTFGDDGLWIENYNDGVVIESTQFSASGIACTTSDDSANYDVNGATKLNFALLTHSLAELDETLQQLVEDALSAGNSGVACTQEQWNAIKALFDKSLYFNYAGISMIKSVVNVNDYLFGMLSTETGELLHIYWTLLTGTLHAKLTEV